MILMKLKPYKWLVVFPGEEEQKTFLEHIARLDEILKKTVKNNIETWIIDDETKQEFKQIKAFDETGKEEILEEFIGFLVDKVIVKKQEVNANKLAIVLRKGQFSSKKVFETIVNEPYFDNKSNYVICSSGYFGDLRKRLECLRTACKDCNDFYADDWCEHSCLVRLLWLIFGQDKHVIEELKHIASNDKSND